MEDIYKRLKPLADQHVRTVRELEKLTKALGHVRQATGELDDLTEEANLTPSFSDLPYQLKAVEATLEEETWRMRVYVIDIETNQNHLRRRLPRWGENPAAR